jgi:hypothetical protein
MNQKEVEIMWEMEADIRALESRVVVETEVSDYWYQRAMAAERKLNFAENGAQFK